MTRHRYSAAYLSAIERRLGAETFGLTIERSEGARLLAALGGPGVEWEWITCFGGPDDEFESGDQRQARRDVAASVLDELIQNHSLAASLIADARALAKDNPAPLGRNALVEFARAGNALDHALACPIPAEIRVRVEEEYYRVERIALDLAGEIAEARKDAEREAVPETVAEVAHANHG